MQCRCMWKMEDDKNIRGDLSGRNKAVDFAKSDAAMPPAEQRSSGSGFASSVLGFAREVLDYIPFIQAPAGDYKRQLNNDPSDPFRGVIPEKGDVLVVSRAHGMYQHYGVYLGDGRVMHYAAEHGDFGGRITIHEADIKEFQGPSDQIFILNFPENGDLPAPSSQESPLFDIIRAGHYHLYSPEETVERARLKEGQEKYGLPWNNCEHFALWAKTGVHESRQVNAWATRIARLIIAAKRGR